MPIKRTLYMVAGVLNVVLGVAGIVLPLLPTTPFLLLAAFLFARSSPRCHHWLLHQKHLSPYIHAFRSRSGLTVTQKIRIGTSISISMGVSVYFAPIVLVKIGLGAMWAFWTVVLIRMKTVTTPTPTA